MAKTENKTKPTGMSPAEFIASVEHDRRREDGNQHHAACGQAGPGRHGIGLRLRNRRRDEGAILIDYRCPSGWISHVVLSS